MAIKITAAPASSNDQFSFSEDFGVQAGGGLAGFTTSLNVRANDGKAKSYPLFSIDDGQSADLATADAVSTEAASRDRSLLGATIWIKADGTVGYSTVPIGAMVESLGLGQSIQDSFLYATRQPNGSLLWSTVRITITGTNDAPVAAWDSAVVSEDALASGSVAANDRDVDSGAVLRFATADAAPGFALASDGRWVLDASHAAYQDLAAGESKTLNLGYTVTDQHGAAANAVLTLTVTGTNDRPVTSAVTAVVDEDGGISGTLSASDADRGDMLSFATVGDVPAGFSLAADGTWALDAGAEYYQALPAGETLHLVIVFAVTDRAGASATSTLSIALSGTNDLPVASAVTVSVAEDGAIAGQLAARDADGGTVLSYALVGDVPAGLALASDGSWSFYASGAAYQALGEGESATVSAAYAVSDGEGGAADATLTFTVMGSNDAPVAGGAIALPDAAEDGAFTITAAQLLAGWGDAEGDTLSVVGLAASNASISANADGSYRLTPAANYHGTIALTYAVSDGRTATNANATVTVTAVNDDPLRTGAAYAFAPLEEDDLLIITADQLLSGWTDADGDPLSVVGSLGASGGTLRDNGDGSFTFDPTTNFTGTSQLNYSVGDGTAARSTFIHLFVSPVNDPAQIWGTPAGFITEDAAPGSVSGNLDAYDVDNSYDSWRAVTSPTVSAQGYGSFTTNAAGQWTFVLANANPTVNALATGQTLSDSFTIYTEDGTAAQIAITIRGATDFSYVPPAVSTAADAMDFDLLNASGTKTSTLFNFYATGADENLDGSNGNDNIYAQGGGDVVYGHNGSDGLFGEIGPETGPALAGVGGNDRLYGQVGNDGLSGGAGDDLLYGGSGNDTLYGNNSQNRFGDTGADQLFGGSGDDRLYGQDGDDILVGGTGADWLTGGTGADRFVYTKASDTGDLVFDFQSGTDLIDLSALGLDPANFVGLLAAPGMVGAGQIGYTVVNGGSQLDTIIYIDTDGVMGADLEIRLIGTPQVTAGDFLF